MSQARQPRSALDFLDTAIQVVCVALTAVIVIAVAAQVVARYVTNDSTPWLAESATYAFVWLTLLSISLGVRRGRHMSLDVWEYIPTPRWLDRLLESIVTLIVLAVLVVLVWYGLEALPAAANRTTPGIGVPFALVSAAVPVGCALSFIFQIELYVRALGADRGRGAKSPVNRTLMDDEQESIGSKEGTL